MKINNIKKIGFSLFTIAFLFGCSRNVDYRSSDNEEEESHLDVSDYSGLFAPENVDFRTDEKKLTWNEVKGAKYYEVLIQSDGIDSYSKNAIKTTSFDLSSYKISGVTVYDTFFGDNENQVLLSIRAYTTASNTSDYSSYLYDPSNHSDSLIYTYSVNKDLNSVSITGFSGYATTDNKENLKLPSKIAGLDVTEVAENAFVKSRNVIVNITIPSSIVKINDNAFSSEKASSTPAIKTITFEDIESSKLEYIGSYAFACLSTLTDVSLPDSLVTIKDNAFLKCSKLANFKMGYENSKLEYVGDNAFDTCRLLPSFYFGKNIKYIGKNAFSTCPKLTSVYFDENINLSEIGTYAFAKSGLTSFYLPKSVESIKEGAFSGCTSLAAFFYDYDSNLNYIGDDSFNGCTSLKMFTRISYNDKTLSIDHVTNDFNLSFENVVNRDLISQISIGLNSSKESVYEFGKENLEGKIDNFYLNIPDDVNYIGDNAFYKTKFTNFYVTTNSSLTHIGESCFASNTSLVEFIIPSKLEYLGMSAFNGDSKLDIFNKFNEEAPSTLKYISFDAFNSTLNGPESNKNIVINNTLISVVDSLKASNSEVILNSITKSYGKDNEKDCKVYYVGPSVFKSSKIKSIDLSGIKEVYDESFASISTLNSLIIPETLEYIGVNAFKDLKYITSFEFKSTKINYISKGAFTNLGSSKSSSIFEISLPDTLEYIGESAFEGVVGLKSFNLNSSSNLNTIEKKAFYNCKNLESFNITSKVYSIGESAFECSSNSSLSLLNLDEATSLEVIGINAFKNTSLVGTINIPDSVKTIDESVFASINSDGFNVCFTNNSSLTNINNEAFANSSILSINIESNVEYIASNAFENASKLNSIIFNNNKIDTIETETFKDCSSLTSINLPDSVNTINDLAFENCTNLTTINSKAKDISTTAFKNSGFENQFDDGFVIYNNVLMKYTGSDTTLDLSKTSIEEISSNAFKNAITLKKITLPSTLKIIGNSAFYGCSSLETVLLVENNIETIEDYAFYNCSKLASFDLNDKISSIGNYAFYNDNISSVYVGNNLKLIGDYAFYNNDVRNIQYSSNSIIETFGAYSFAYNSIEEFNLPNNSITLKEYSFAYSFEVTNLTIPSNVNALGYSFYGSDSINKLTIDSSKPITIIFGGNASVVPQSLKEVNILDGNETIASNCFAGCGSIEIINLPNSIKNIGNYTFYGCRSIVTLNIKNVNSIGDYAFAGTTSLSFSKDDFVNVNSIGDYAFLSSNAIDSFDDEFVIINGILVKSNSSKSVIKFSKDEINVIVGGAFAGNNDLKTLTIEGDVTIHSGAFDNCYNFTTLNLNYINEDDLSSIVNIELNVFDNVKNLKIVVPSKLKEAYKNDIYWKLYADKIK